MTKSSKSARDNRANQLNPKHAAYHQSRGAAPSQAQQKPELSKPALDNRANQLNPNHDATAASRGESQASSSDASSAKSE